MEGICEVCHKLKTVHHNRKTGKTICGACCFKDPATHEICVQCGRSAFVYRRTKHGKPLCQKCGVVPKKKKRKVCAKCGQAKRNVKRRRRTDELMCPNCYEHRDTSQHEKCSRCGAVRYVCVRDSSGKPICANCHRKDLSTHEKCSICGERRRVEARTKSREPVCRHCCSREGIGRCIVCGQTAILFPSSRLCIVCYDKRHDTSRAIAGSG